MLSALIKKAGVGILYVAIAVLMIKYIPLLNNMIFSLGSWLFFKLGPGGLEWIGSDYQWGEDPVTFVIAIAAILVIAWAISRLVRLIMRR